MGLANKLIAYNRCPQVSYVVPLFHATNVSKKDWQGASLEPHSSPVEVFHERGIIAANYNLDQAKYLFAGENKQDLIAMMFKTRQCWATSTESGRDGLKMIHFLSSSLDEYLASVSHVGRLFEIPVSEVNKAGFRPVLDLKGNSTGKHISPNAVPLKACKETSFEIQKDFWDKGAQVYYPKNGFTALEWQQLAKAKKTSATNPEFLKGLEEQGKIGVYSTDS